MEISASKQPLLNLFAGPYQLVIDPAQGGSIRSFTFEGQAILRSQTRDGILESASFPLVPFSNRIAGSQFRFGKRLVQLAPNHPVAPSEPVLHGFGWLAEWQAVEVREDHARLEWHYTEGDWPWAFAARQDFALSGSGLKMSLSLTNCSPEPMPAGLGFHPYFPRTATTRLASAHRGEWKVDTAQLPTALDEREGARDWWDGRPVGSRIVDTVYTGREEALRIEWPERGLEAKLEPSSDLGFTVIYVPDGEDFFCVEPVSHATDAFNRNDPVNGMRVLAPGEAWDVQLRISAEGRID